MRWGQITAADAELEYLASGSQSALLFLKRDAKFKVRSISLRPLFSPNSKN